MSDLLEVMVRDRGEAKTTETILWLLRAPKEYDRPRRVLLCANAQRAQSILREYPGLNGFIFTLRSWQGGRGFGRDVEVAIDDAEQFLYELAQGSNLTRITMTGKSI